MKIFLAGGSGAIGKRLVPVLVANGHDVVATTTSQAKLFDLRDLGAEGVVLDVLDRNAVMAALLRAEPDVVIHEATALADLGSFRNMDKEFALTNRLRTEGTDNLLEAARAAGARRFVAQSFTGWPNEKKGRMIKTEEDPLDADPLPRARQGMAAIRHLESVVTGAQDIEGVVLALRRLLRSGHLARQGRRTRGRGPQTPLPDRWRGHRRVVLPPHRRRRVCHCDGGRSWRAGPLQHRGRRSRPGQRVAAGAGRGARRASRPRHAPVWLGKLLAGSLAVSMMTEMRGSSNAKAKRELGWQPRYRSWRDGFIALGLRPATAVTAAGAS